MAMVLQPDPHSAGPKGEEATAGMYPPEWWWAERQVSEILAEHPGELVKTGASRGGRKYQDYL